LGCGGGASRALSAGRNRRVTIFLVVRRHDGAEYDASRPLEEQSDWAAYVSFMNGLENEGFVVVGGPLAGERRTVLVVDAESEDAVRATLTRDLWSETHLRLDTIDPWSIRLGRIS
jgi:hypothetical protein